MNTSLKAAAIIALSAGSFGLATARPWAPPTIITPITIVKIGDMSFGNIAPSAVMAGTVILDPAGKHTTGHPGGPSFPAATGTMAAARFTVAGEPRYIYAITLPVNADLSDGGTNSMSINRFTSFPANIGILNGGGTQDLKVGATLNVAASQAAGIYTNTTTVHVTINYN